MKRDDIWKRVIEKFFNDFVSFFMPDLYKDIDFSVEKKFLDKELQKISVKSQRKNRRVDELVEVKLKDGTERWLLLHIEVQGYDEPEFATRMYKYQYRIFDKFDKDVIALAIFIDGDENFKPNKYEKSLYETKISYEYKIYKVLDQNENKLRQNNNPFALVILASLFYLKAKNNQNKRYSYKIKLVELLSGKNYTQEEINDLFDFIDILIGFKNKKLEELFYEEVNKMSKVKEKELIGGFKRIAIKVAIKERDVQIVKNFYKLGVEIDKISHATELSIKEIEEILKNMPQEE